MLSCLARVITRERYVYRLVEVMMWEAIAHGHLCPPSVSTWNQRSIQQMMKTHIPTYPRTLRNSLFHQNITKAHVARVTFDCFGHNQIILFPWPPRSLNLSPIEHIWDVVKFTPSLSGSSVALSWGSEAVSPYSKYVQACQWVHSVPWRLKIIKINYYCWVFRFLSSSIIGRRLTLTIRTITYWRKS